MGRQGLALDAECDAHVVQSEHAVPEERVGVKEVEDAVVLEAILGAVD